jgi:hypothetical protein
VPVEVAVNRDVPLVAQLDHFLEVMDGAAPLIDVADGARTLEVALEIEAGLAASLQKATAPDSGAAGWAV